MSIIEGEGDVRKGHSVMNSFSSPSVSDLQHDSRYGERKGAQTCTLMRHVMTREMLEPG